MNEEDIYSENYLSELLDDEVISTEEYGFMVGYLGRGENYV